MAAMTEVVVPLQQSKVHADEILVAIVNNTGKVP